MELIIIAILAFGLGYFGRPTLHQLWYWNRPVHCPECGKYTRFKYTVACQHRVAGWVRICNVCWRGLYQPGKQES